MLKDNPYVLLILCIVIFLIYIFWDSIHKRTKQLKYEIHVGGKKLSMLEFMLSNFEKKKRKKIRNKTENHCRRIIERRFGRTFPSVRPDFLKNPATGKNLELDIYNSDMKLAFEYNGVQHYKFTPFFHKSYKDFEKQQLHDEYKKKVCARLGIKLISIPYTVKFNDLERWILNECKNI